MSNPAETGWDTMVNDCLLDHARWERRHLLVLDDIIAKEERKPETLDDDTALRTLRKCRAQQAEQVAEVEHYVLARGLKLPEVAL